MMYLGFLIFASLAGILAAFLTVCNFLRDFYEIRRFSDAIIWLLSSFCPLFRRFVDFTIREGEIADPECPVVRIGGPGYVIIREDSAAVFEQYGRITRVLGPGYHLLMPSERPRGVVDLRPQVHRVQVRGFTRDGIPLQGEVEIEYQIRQMSRIELDQTTRRARRFRAFYTFSWEGVLNAIYRAPLREGVLVPHREIVGEEVSYWFQRVIERHNFSELLASYPEVMPERGHGLLSRDIILLLESELFNTLRGPLRSWGYQINRLQVNALDVEEEIRERVRDKTFGLWRSLRLAKLRTREAEAEVSALRIKSEARAYVEAQFIEALAYEITRAGPSPLRKQIILAIACMNVLDNLVSILKDESQFLIPSWILDQIDRFKKILALP